MKLSVKTEKINPFLKRKELHVAIGHEGEPTPTKAAVADAVAKEKVAHEGHVDVRNIFSLSGSGNSKSKVFIWDEKIVKKEKLKEENIKEKEVEKKGE